MRVTSDQKRQILQAYIKQGVSKEVAKMILHSSPPEVLQGIWVNASRGLKLPVGDSKGAGKPIAAQRISSRQEAVEFLTDEHVVIPPSAPVEAKSVLFSFKIGSDDLERLRNLSEADGESVAVLLRQAVRDYLSSRGVRR
ncbi:ribbon-helix-helix protein, CopG family [Azotobacter chroococcum]|uniref:ribbon-helix-helix protein, CopG family n=1 Tax=Azotobacter chroococcum TaxID=353 RepID=UPI0009E49EAC|nr:ribbon-helix-helix protein, CopG family [Azotobacter chroococcum]